MNYKIETNDKYFRITRSDNSFSLLELERSKFVDVKQNGLLLVAEKGENLYDLYLPSSSKPCSKTSLLASQLYLVATDVRDYLVYEDLLVFKQSEPCYKFLYIPNFITALAEENYLSKRLEQLPSLPCQAGDFGGIRSGFGAISHINKDYGIRFCVFHLGIEDYLITIEIHDRVIPIYDSGIKITHLGLAIPLHWNGLFFKSKDRASNEYWHEFALFEKEGSYAKIEKMKKADYPSIYRSKACTGYWKKDNQGFILGVTFVLKATPVSYSIRLETPVKELRFVKTLEEKSLSNHHKTDILPELWQVTTLEDTKAWLLVSWHSNTYTLIPDEIFSES